MGGIINRCLRLFSSTNRYGIEDGNKRYGGVHKGEGRVLWWIKTGQAKNQKYIYQANDD